MPPVYKRRPMPSISFHDIPQNIVVFFQILKGIECEMRQCESLPQVWQPSWKWRNINTLVSLYTRTHTHTHMHAHFLLLDQRRLRFFRFNLLPIHLFHMWSRMFSLSEVFIFLFLWVASYRLTVTYISWILGNSFVGVLSV